MEATHKHTTQDNVTNIDSSHTNWNWLHLSKTFGPKISNKLSEQIKINKIIISSNFDEQLFSFTMRLLLYPWTSSDVMEIINWNHIMQMLFSYSNVCVCIMYKTFV